MNTNRTISYSEKQYNKAWACNFSDIFRGRKIRKYAFGGSNKFIFATPADSRKVFIQHLFHKIKSVGAKEILELGSGVGINLVALAVLCPEIEKIHGVELTENGIKQSEFLLSNYPIRELKYLTELDEEVIVERLNNFKSKVFFERGDICKLSSIGEEKFDFVFSYGAIEQIPKLFSSAFAEARRVLKKTGNALFVEEFREFQNLRQKYYLWKVDYFSESYKEVEKVGFRALSFEPLINKKDKFVYASLFCEKI